MHVCAQWYDMPPLAVNIRKDMVCYIRKDMVCYIWSAIYIYQGVACMQWDSKGEVDGDRGVQQPTPSMTIASSVVSPRSSGLPP